METENQNTGNFFQSSSYFKIKKKNFVEIEKSSDLSSPKLGKFKLLSTSPRKDKWTIVHPKTMVFSEVSNEDYTNFIFKGVEEVMALINEKQVGWTSVNSQDCVGR